MNLIIRDMTTADIECVCKLLEDVITETYKINNLKNDDLYEFIAEKKHGIKEFNGNDKCKGIYKCAFCNGILVGIGGIYPLCKDILLNIDDQYKNELEIGSLYIHVDYQKKGIAKELMAKLVNEIVMMNKEYFFLDCGYKSSQLYWERILGAPYKRLESYFDANEHYLIWKIETKEAKRIFKTENDE
ncbi:MAG: Acetyltransferase (GNAT) family protein [Candidatus Methanofastidiosum methylothiophilum]|jgi:ribosomal protein S18 acetylase RimI-like enzyme|uniref:Acetyltransferase (GNAT) family protein n=1 Tax=Candidatus Methanofastidiosum methylothiophilum TaxID=1705564 RepID=A0A150IW78_9EURY|nr:MAG: Acetyltransferase (GNAT) family protein [Candidatus Methanofastidiosum methylthiophilus]